MGRHRACATLVAAALALLAVASPASAQVNAEALRVTLRTNPTFLWLDGSLVSRAGNSPGAVLSASAFAGVTRPPHLFFAKASANYTTTAQNTLIVARSLVHARYNYETTPFLSLELFTQVQHDLFRRIAVRDLYGTGLRFNWIRTDAFELFSGSTVVLEQQVISSTDRYPGESEVRGRWSNYLGVNMALATYMQLNTATYVQPRLDRPRDVRVLHESIVTLAITKRLAAKVSANVVFDSRPAAGVLNADLEVRNSIAVKF